MAISAYEKAISRRASFGTDRGSYTREFVLEGSSDPEEVRQWLYEPENIPRVWNSFHLAQMRFEEIGLDLWKVNLSYSPVEVDLPSVDQTTNDLSGGPQKPKQGEAKLTFTFGSEEVTVDRGKGDTGPLDTMYSDPETDTWVSVPNGPVDVGPFFQLWTANDAITLPWPKFIGMGEDGEVSGVSVKRPVTSFKWDFSLPENFIANPVYLRNIMDLVGHTNNGVFMGLPRECVLLENISGDIHLVGQSGDVKNRLATLSFEFKYKKPQELYSGQSGDTFLGLTLPAGGQDETMPGFWHMDVLVHRKVDSFTVGTEPNDFVVPVVNVFPRRASIWRVYPTADFRLLQIPGTIDPSDYN